MSRTLLVLLALGTGGLASCASLTPAPNQRLASAQQACAEIGIGKESQRLSNCALSLEATIEQDDSQASY